MASKIKKFFKNITKIHHRGSTECREAYYNTYGDDCDGDCSNCPFAGY